MPTVRSVTLGFWIATGSAAENVAEAGLSHLVEHMLFRGTDRYGSLEIDQIFDTMGAELNAGTGKESTSVYARVIDEHLQKAFDVVADMVWRPRFDAEDLVNEQEIVLEEIAMYEDDPQDRVFDVLGEAVFGDHPLRPSGHRARGGRLGRVGRGPRGVPRRRTTSPATSSLPLPGRCRTRPSSSWRARSRSRARRRAVGRRGAARLERGADPLPAQGHRAVPPHARRAGPRARRRAPLRAAHLRQHPRRHVVVAALSRGARAARPCLQRLLLPVAVRRRPARSGCTSARGRTTSRPRCRSSPTSSSGCAATASPRRSSSAPSRTSRAAWCCRSSRRRRA